MKSTFACCIISMTILACSPGPAVRGPYATFYEKSPPGEDYDHYTKCGSCQGTGSNINGRGGIQAQRCQSCKGIGWSRKLVLKVRPGENWEKCPVCVGFTDGTCAGCQGKGYLPIKSNPDKQLCTKCIACYGTGRVIRKGGAIGDCHSCDGEGWKLIGFNVLPGDDWIKCAMCNMRGKKITASAVVDCINCKGIGYILPVKDKPNDKWAICSLCEGHGKIPRYEEVGTFTKYKKWNTSNCSSCLGRGWTPPAIELTPFLQKRK